MISCATILIRRTEVDPLNWTTRDVKLIRDHCSIPRSVMTGTKKRHSAAFRARVALEAAKQTRTLAELSGVYQVHSVQISKWKKQLRDGIESLHRDGRLRDHDESQAIQAELYEQIGRLKMEVERLKKKLPAVADLKRPLINPSISHLNISI
jgi:transposase-like protein